MQSWTLDDRVAWARRFRWLVAAHQDRLCQLIHAEVHKPLAEALTGDVMTLLAAIKWHENHARSLLATRRLSSRPLWLMGQRHWVTRQPVGTVAIIATWNYPVQLLGVQLLQAIMAGNRVVVKPSEHAPRTQAELLSLAFQAGLPENQLRWTDASRDAGPRLLASEHFDHVIFTGSTAVGKQVAAWAAQTMTPTTLELSGHDSAIVLAGAHVKLAASSIWQAVTMNAGQTCMAPRRAIVSARAYPGFVSALSYLAAAARPMRLIDEAAANRCRELTEDALRQGARSLLGTRETSDGPWLRPLALTGCTPQMDITQGTHFGPLLAVMAARDDDDAMALHAQYRHLLCTGIFDRDERRAREQAAQVKSGFIAINDCHLPTAHPGASILGIGPSGWGVSRGAAGLMELTRPVTVSTTSPRWRIPTGDADARSLGVLRKLSRWLYCPRASGKESPSSPIAQSTGQETPSSMITTSPQETIR